MKEIFELFINSVIVFFAGVFTVSLVVAGIVLFFSPVALYEYIGWWSIPAAFILCPLGIFLVGLVKYIIE